MFRTEKPILLGSGSPRRREFLEQLGLDLVVLAPEVDETVIPGETPSIYLERIVEAKLNAVRAGVVERDYAAILVADTSVVLAATIFGKPADESEALKMLRALVGNTHQVMTRYAVYSGGEKRAATVSSAVTFRDASEDEVRAYVRSGEGVDKAGGYAIQGLGASLVRSIEGSYSTIVGLPVAEVVTDLVSLGAVSLVNP